MQISRLALLASVLFALCLTHAAPVHAQFTVSELDAAIGGRATSLDFGPDGRLYVSMESGRIRAYDVVKNGSDDYAATTVETIDLIKTIVTYNDDGTLSSETNRQVTGLIVEGTATNPVIYVTSSDPRIGAGGAGDLNLDTNSGILSSLTWNGSSWDKVDLIRGLPRSEENHATNGMFYDTTADILYIAQGGNTNAGGTSINFAYHTEYALSAAVLEVDMSVINALPLLGTAPNQYVYDLPTVDDPDRPGTTDLNDPFGGNDGLNQAKLVAGGPVQIFASGFRNPYDVIRTSLGHMFTIDNGGNGGWGGYPVGEGTSGCTTDYPVGEPGAVNNLDGLHLISSGYYAGHPNPIRGNPAGAGIYTHDGTTGVWRTSTTGSNPLPSDWPPVPVSMANPDECDFRLPGAADGSLALFDESTNGMAEYTATGSMQGDILVVGYDGNVHHVDMDAAGTGVNSVSLFASGFAGKPLDIVAVGDGGPLAGTVWVANYGTKSVSVFEPSGGGSCSGADDPLLDEDSDFYDNADEIDAGSNPCSAASLPPDADGDLTSDINDPDDDNDGLSDIIDAFAVDADNGATTSMPLYYDFFNADPGTGFYGIGMTGLMTDGTSDYLDLQDPDGDLIAGGTAGLLTDPVVGIEDATGATNSQVNGLQFGFDSDAGTSAYTVTGQINGPFFNGSAPSGGQYQGLYIGSGDQDNYLRIAVGNTSGGEGFLVEEENGGSSAHSLSFPVPGLTSASAIQLQLIVDPAAATVQPAYTISGTQTLLGGPLAVSGSLLQAILGTHQISGQPSGLAVGVVASAGPVGASFPATWDWVKIAPVTSTGGGSGTWAEVAADNKGPGRHEVGVVGYQDALWVMGGRSGARKIRRYFLNTNRWNNRALAPTEMHHFQGVVYNNQFYVIGGLSGTGSTEAPLPNVHIYTPASNSWSLGPAMPAGRERGSAGVAVFGDKIYMAGGLSGGHGSPGTAYALFDEFDPATGTWTAMPDMPRARDHFQAVVVGSKLYAIGGRDSGVSDFFEATIPEVDVFDFAAGTWSTLPASANLPTERAGATSVFFDGKIFVVGGESGQPLAHDETEAFDPVAETWETLDPLVTGRHATGGAVLDGKLWTASGSAEQGSNPELKSLEHFDLGGIAGNTPPELAAIGAKSSLTTDSVNEVFSASDGDGDPLNWTVTGLPDGLTFDEPTTTVSGTPTVPGVFSVSVAVDDGTDSDSEMFNWTIIEPSGGGGDYIALYRINAGGNEEDAADASTPVWEVDTQTSPSAFGNKSAAKSRTGGFSQNPDIPAYMPASVPVNVFKKERYDRSKGDEMRWDFPVTVGTGYRIRLFFAERSKTAAGQRSFDVEVEGTVPASLDDLDIFALAGGKRLPYMVELDITATDDNLDIDFIRDLESPFINGIEILEELPPAAKIASSSTVVLHTADPVRVESLEGDEGTRLRIESLVDLETFTIEYTASEDGSIRELGTIEADEVVLYPITGLRPGRYSFRVIGTTADGSEVYSSQLDVTTTMSDPAMIFPAFPNPSDQYANVDFAVRDQAPAVITMYDITGRTVRTLHNGIAEPQQTHRLRIETSDLAVGAYFVVLTSKGTKSVTKLMVSR